MLLLCVENHCICIMRQTSKRFKVSLQETKFILRLQCKILALIWKFLFWFVSFICFLFIYSHVRTYYILTKPEIITLYTKFPTEWWDIGESGPWEREREKWFAMILLNCFLSFLLRSRGKKKKGKLFYLEYLMLMFCELILVDVTFFFPK